MAKSANNYTKPELREKLKKKVIKGSKGGNPGQWSARKAQLLASEYKAAGGGYKEGKQSEGQKHLNQWTSEKWRTADRKKAKRKAGGKKTMARYLPDAAWKKLSPAEKRATDKKKREGTAKGKQFVGNTSSAKKARKGAAKKKAPAKRARKQPARKSKAKAKKRK